MRLQRPHRSVPIDLGEAYELLNGSLLLGAVYCRHFALAACVSRKASGCKVRGAQ